MPVDRTLLDRTLLDRALPERTLPPTRRVRAGAHFKRCQQGGRRVHTTHFVWLVYVRADVAPARLGLVVSRRVGCAVRRNRVKRLLREVFRARSWPAGLDLVVIAKAPPPTLGLADVQAELTRALPELERRVRQAGADARARGEAATSAKSG